VLRLWYSSDMKRIRRKSVDTIVLAVGVLLITIGALSLIASLVFGGTQRVMDSHDQCTAAGGAIIPSGQCVQIVHRN
jgi:hypothetical protein